jgi:hypothetical protein
LRDEVFLDALVRDRRRGAKRSDGGDWPRVDVQSVLLEIRPANARFGSDLVLQTGLALSCPLE